MARSARFERATICLEGRCSIHLSYEREWLWRRLRVGPGAGDRHQRSLFPGTRWSDRSENPRQAPETRLTTQNRNVPFGVYFARFQTEGKLV